MPPDCSTTMARHVIDVSGDGVIGGIGAFIIAVRNPSEFVPAIRRKLILEIAGRDLPVLHIAAISPRSRADCLIGERMWNQWMERYRECVRRALLTAWSVPTPARSSPENSLTYERAWRRGVSSRSLGAINGWRGSKGRQMKIFGTLVFGALVFAGISGP